MIKILLVFLLFISSPAYALTPIVRNDVVPYQRIEYGTTFNFGAPAFSKEGIEKVDFVISGQGYSGGTKTATSMTLNDRTDVWEYWVPISSSEFITNGPITITTTATSSTSLDTKVLPAITLIVEATAAYSHYECWVDGANGNDGTGAVGNSSLPYQTISAAVSACQIANGGSSDGNIIYLEDGTYSISGISATTSSEWITISLAFGAVKENTVINAGQLSTNLLKVTGVTLQSTGSDMYVIGGSSPSAWVDNCSIIGSGRYVSNSNPVSLYSEDFYSTDTTTYDTAFAYQIAGLVRGAAISHIGNDAFQNTRFIINSTVTDMDPGASGTHGDVIQTFDIDTGQPAVDNRIVYGLKATDIHISGGFLTSAETTATNNAFVNILIEMREPSVPNESGVHDFSAFSMAQTWDHLIVWNCTFPLGGSLIASATSNGSVVGNLFWQYRDESEGSGSIGDETLNHADFGNAENNVFLDNHYMYVYGMTGADSCTPTSADDSKSHPCPHWYAKAPDSQDVGVSYTAGGTDVIVTTPGSTIGMPVAGSPIIDRFSALIPADIDGNVRGVLSDVGAYEYQTAAQNHNTGSMPLIH